MRVLVLGGTRFMGPFVVRELVAAGAQVTVFHRGESEGSLPASIEHVHGDFETFGDHVEELRRRRPGLVLEMLALRPEHVGRVAALADIAQRAVVLSSADVYRAFGRVWQSEPGEPDPVPLGEDAPLRKVVIHEEYDKTGVEAELAGLDLLTTVLRLPAVHGPNDAQHRLYPYLKRMDDRRPAILLPGPLAGWSWTRGYVENVAHAIALACLDERAAGHVYNVQDTQVFTEAEWVKAIAATTGWTGDVVVCPPDLLPESLRWSRYDLRQDVILDTGRIRRELGFAEPISVDEGLRRTIEWERANPPPELDPAEWDYAAEDRALLAVP